MSSKFLWCSHFLEVVDGIWFGIDKVIRVESQDWVSVLEEKDMIFDSSTPLPDENVSEDYYLQINKTDFTRKKVNRCLHCGLQNLPSFGEQTHV